MAEQEVLKHTKKVYRIWNRKEHSAWHRIKEIIIEIFIIVFAVSLSIWFHNRSEHTHQQGEAKQFLLGLRQDLSNDIKEMMEDKKAYFNQEAAFSYITSLKPGESPDADSLQFHRNWLFNMTGLHPNNGRFEGFKASGKIGTIEDNNLQNDIMDLYQEDIPDLLYSTTSYTTQKNKLLDYVNENRKRTSDSTTNFKSLMVSDQAQNLSRVLSDTREIIERYDICLKKMGKIVAAIDKAYK